MPRKVLLIVGAVIILILILAAGFYISQKSQKTQAEKPASQATEAPVSEQTGTIKGLLAMGKDLTCDVSYSVEQNKTVGKINVAGQKMSGDFTITTSDGKTMDMHMIQKDGYIYSWSSALPQGTKMKIPAESASPTPAPSGVSTGFNPNQQVQYKCSPWGVDDSKFNPPSTVQFMDISAMTKSPGASQAPSGQSGTSMCASITDPQAKAACEAYSK